MAVIEHGINREIIRDFAKTSLKTRLAAGAADAGLGVANDSGCPVDNAGGDQGSNGEVGGRGIAAGIRDQSRATNALAAEFGQSHRRLRRKSPGAVCSSLYQRA